MTSPPDPADLAAETRVAPDPGQPGRFTAALTSAFSFVYPSGGVVMTAALRAMDHHLAEPTFVPVSATATFCAPIPAGPLVLDVVTLRRGRAASQLRASVRAGNSEEAGAEVTATFGRPGEGPEVHDATPPVVPGPDAAPDWSGRFRAPFFRQFDLRGALGHAADTRWEPAEARTGRWFRYRVPQRTPDGAFDPFAVPPIIDTMPGALAEKLGPDAPPFIAPSLDLTVHFLDRSDADWHLVLVHGRRAARGFGTCDAELWDPAGRLVAVATQTMILRPFPAGWEPPR